MRGFGVLLIFLAVVLIIVSSVLVATGFNVKDHYSYENKYVGGDAYNYIINASYFAGYMALSGALYICSIIMIVGGTLILKRDIPQNNYYKADYTNNLDSLQQ